MVDNRQLWENSLSEIELEVSKANYNTWFKDTFVFKQEENIVYLGVPNQFVKDWLSNKYHSFILKTLRKASDNVRGLEYIVSKNNPYKKSISESVYSRSINELPLSDFYINKEDNLNPRYIFESFIVGSFNELAFAAAQAVVNKPGIAYNPLFIYGKTGHGKTHLIQAIGNQIKTADPSKKVYYVTSERFALDYLASLQMNNVNSFKERYRKYDVLIMDDIQFFSNKEKTQEELFHVFNTMYDNNRQIIFSSDKHVNYIPGLEERLKSRFSAGMIIDIPTPDHESRMAILQSKAKQNNIDIPEEIIQYLSLSIEGNIRELEGTLNMIICQTKLKDKCPSINEVKNLIKNNIKPKKTVPVKDIVKAVADFYNIGEDEIYKKTRKKEVVKPRQLIMYILREDFNIPYPTIGQKLGGRDHTTVIHSYEKVKNDLKLDGSLIDEINQIRTMI
jgi:chromosomal replication initiator protein